jgi:indolepyruvate ferredoxin oxidoreductase alpha subunit
VQQHADLVLVILDNKWVAMTGHQPSPTTDVSIHGEKMNPVDIKGLLKSIGVKYIRSIDPFNVKASIAAVRDALRQEEGVRVIIAEQECALQFARRIKIAPPEYAVYYQIERGRCQLCNECYVDLGCPAIRKDFENDEHFYYIEETACLRCGACKDLCPNGAIVRTEIKLHPGTSRETEKVS